MEIRIMTQSPHSEILNCLTTRPLGVPFSSILPTCALEGLAEKLHAAQHTARMPCGRHSVRKTTSLAFKTNMKRYYAGLFWEMREHDGWCVGRELMFGRQRRWPMSHRPVWWSVLSLLHSNLQYGHISGYFDLPFTSENCRKIFYFSSSITVFLEPHGKCAS